MRIGGKEFLTFFSCISYHSYVILSQRGTEHQTCNGKFVVMDSYCTTEIF